MPKLIRNQFKDFIFLLTNNYPIMHIKSCILELPIPNKSEKNLLKNELKKNIENYENILRNNFGDYDLFDINQLHEKIKLIPIKEKTHYLWLNHRYIALKDISFFILNLQILKKNIEKK